MLIADSQVHIWGADTPERPWPAGRAHQAQKPYPVTAPHVLGHRLTRMPCTYRECASLFTEELPWLKGEDLEWVMGRGVCEWLDWPLPAR